MKKKKSKVEYLTLEEKKPKIFFALGWGLAVFVMFLVIFLIIFLVLVFFLEGMVCFITQSNVCHVIPDFVILIPPLVGGLLLGCFAFHDALTDPRFAKYKKIRKTYKIVKRGSKR